MYFDSLIEVPYPKKKSGKKERRKMKEKVRRRAKRGVKGYIFYGVRSIYRVF